MLTRSGLCYPKPESENPIPTKRRRTTSKIGLGLQEPHRKRPLPASPSPTSFPDFFDALPDDLVLSILSKLAASASSPSDLVSVLISCKRLKELGTNSMVLSKASPKSVTIRATNWSESAHRFLKRCADSGNLEACYFLGMIRFYCLGSRGSGGAFMARAAMGSHAAALYALAVIQFNGSGGAKANKDLAAGVALCARAAFLGHLDALRELGHCLQDGYGVRRDVAEGRHFLIQANLRELAAMESQFKSQSSSPAAANRFMVEWFARKGVGEGRRMCSYDDCGRPETRRHEFRRCSVCGVVNYCSRACQATHWKVAHKVQCVPAEGWALVAGAGDGVGDAVG